jgi:Ca2+-binding EF-hand superfamily protein
MLGASVVFCRAVLSGSQGEFTMKNVTRLTGLAACLALTGTIGVQAESHKSGMHGHGAQGAMQMRPDFDAIDTDGDGRITPAELAAHMQTRLEGADSDGDGMLSRGELIAHMMARQADRMARRADRLIDRHDADGDGRLSLHDMQTRRQVGMMRRMDRNGDGAISREEFNDRHARAHDRRHGTKDRNAGE